MKLHLGCGQIYLDGYLNVDFPAGQAGWQGRSKADMEADLLGLRFGAREAQEVRLHHVFEHFTRPVAYGLLASWQSWLEPGGVLRIEVPDFDRTSRHVINPLTRPRRKKVGLRHIFGSNEADWAVHYEGWSGRRLREAASAFGFDRGRLSRNRWRGTYNVEITARRGGASLSAEQCEERARRLLSDFLVDDSELRILEGWMDLYRQQVARSFATSG